MISTMNLAWVLNTILYCACVGALPRTYRPPAPSGFWKLSLHEPNTRGIPAGEYLLQSLTNGNQVIFIVFLFS